MQEVNKLFFLLCSVSQLSCSVLSTDGTCTWRLISQIEIHVHACISIFKKSIVIIIINNYNNH